MEDIRELASRFSSFLVPELCLFAQVFNSLEYLKLFFSGIDNANVFGVDAC